MAKIKYPQRVIITDEVNQVIISNQPMKANETVEIKQQKRKLSPKQKMFLNKKDEWKTMEKNLGGYVNMQYVKNELLYNNIGLDLGDITKLIYLSTYLEYNMNRLVYKGHQNKTMPMDRNKIKEVVGIKGGAFDRFYINAINSGLLIKSADGEHFMNSEYFLKGDISFKGSYTRIFINTTRGLYESCLPRQHKTLAYVFRLIPTLDYKTNKVCNEEGKPMNQNEIGEFLGVNSKSNLSKLIKDLYKIHIYDKDTKHHLFRRVIIQGAEGRTDFFVANPKIVYGGNIETQEEMKETLANLVFKEELN